MNRSARRVAASREAAAHMHSVAVLDPGAHEFAGTHGEQEARELVEELKCCGIGAASAAGGAHLLDGAVRDAHWRVQQRQRQQEAGHRQAEVMISLISSSD